MNTLEQICSHITDPDELDLLVHQELCDLQREFDNLYGVSDAGKLQVALKQLARAKAWETINAATFFKVTESLREREEAAAGIQEPAKEQAA